MSSAQPLVLVIDDMHWADGDSHTVPVYDEASNRNHHRKIRIGDRPFISQLPFHLADDEGYFAEEGIEVTFTMFDTGTSTVNSQL